MILGIIGFLIGAIIVYILSFIIPREKIKQHNAQLDADEASQQRRILDIQHNADLESERFNALKTSNDKDISLLNTQKQNLEKEIEQTKDFADKQAESYYNEKIAKANEQFTKALDIMEISMEREAKAKQEKHLLSLDALKQEYEDMRVDATIALAEKIKNARAEFDELTATIGFLKSCVNVATAEQQRAKMEAQAKDFYRVVISQEDIEEIAKLRAVVPYLRNAEVINKVIWSYYYKTPANDMINRVLGTEAKMGIYKITNLNDGMVYVGQAVNVRDRWLQHIKRGIGAENGGRVKLYPAMYSEGIENFTFELLDECTQEELNEKEKYWIDFYNGVEYGYNMKL